jgi:hypothetical protein
MDWEQRCLLRCHGLRAKMAVNMSWIESKDALEWGSIVCLIREWWYWERHIVAWHILDVCLQPVKIVDPFNCQAISPNPTFSDQYSHVSRDQAHGVGGSFPSSTYTMNVFENMCQMFGFCRKTIPSIVVW